MNKECMKKLLVVLLLVLFCAQSIGGAIANSATWDETHYFGIGSYLLKHFQWDVPGSILHPPLAFYLTSIPLLFSQMDDRLWQYQNRDRTDLTFLATADIYRGQQLLSSPQNAHDRLLILCRLMTIAIGLILGVYVYLLSKSLYGWTGGFAALFFYTFCPNMLAHAGLITIDMTFTAFFFIAIYYFRQSLADNTLSSFLLSGLALGLALLSKFTALVLLPIEAILLAAFLLKGNRVAFASVCISLACALLVLLLGYGFNLTPLIQGIRFQYAHAAQGHMAFLMGEYSVHGWWYYYPIAFLIKTPIPLLLLVSASLALLFRNVKAIPMDALFLLVPVISFFIFFIVNHQSIGLRYILPVYPFLFVLAGGAVVQLNKIRFVSYILMAWYAFSTIALYPNYLAYFNEAVGGPRNGYRYLVDSNLDWGQDLKRLKAYMEKNGIDTVYLSYFGSDTPERYGIRYNWLPSYDLKNPEPGGAIKFPIKGYVAISVTNLQGVYFGDHDLYRWLMNYSPVARIGYSILLYNIP